MTARAADFFFFSFGGKGGFLAERAGDSAERLDANFAFGKIVETEDKKDKTDLGGREA